MVRMLHAIGRVAVVVTGTIVVWAGPAQAQSCAPFTDVLASSSFCGNIQWLFNRGITQGCTATEYCPASFVRRDQIAAFLNRLADNLFPLTCASGQVMKWNNGTWACASDDVVGGANGFVQGGNAFGATAVLGTNDVQPLEIKAGNARVMRYEPNAISPNVIGGSPVNGVAAGVRGATIAGGGVPGGIIDPPFHFGASNSVTDAYGTVGGGSANIAGDNEGTTADRPFGTVSGGHRNWAAGFAASIGGGRSNTAAGVHATVGGGGGNGAWGSHSTVGGGDTSGAWGSHSTVGGGYNHRAAGDNSTVAGGYSNEATGQSSTISGGEYNDASGISSTVAGGTSNIASGDYSFAAGVRARAQFGGCYVWAGGLSVNDTSCSGPNQFIARALGGFYFFTGGDSDATYTGAHLATGSGAWAAYSDRRGKREFQPVDAAAVLDKVVSLPISTWQWKAEADGIRHMGPTAQDFRAAFGLGPRETEIVTVDADGVALAAIQGLNAKLQAEVAALRAELAELRVLVVERAARASR
jgi:hypothetical protein